MSDTKNHKLAIQAIIEAHRTPGKMREIMLQVLCDDPAKIVNAWEKVRPEIIKSPVPRCRQCNNQIYYPMIHGICGPCSALIKQS